MRKLFVGCVVLVTLWGTSIGLAGDIGPGGRDGGSGHPLIGTTWILVSLGERDIPSAPSAVTFARSPGALPTPDSSAEAKILFDLDRLGADGLQGPPDGRRALHYEYCIPDRPEAIEAVSGIDPTLQIQRNSPGRVGCGTDELLCLGHTHQPDHGAVLRGLAQLPFIGKIREAFFE